MNNIAKYQKNPTMIDYSYERKEIGEDGNPVIGK